jgi:hypothetical protein
MDQSGEAQPTDAAMPARPQLERTITALRTHAEHPHQRIESHAQIANVVNLPVECFLVRADNAVHQKRRPATG